MKQSDTIKLYHFVSYFQLKIFFQKDFTIPNNNNQVSLFVLRVVHFLFQKFCVTIPKKKLL